MEISAKLVSDLRKATGSPMMDCKKALTEAEGDMEKAIVILRERGQAKAAKRINNETNEGVIFCEISEDNKTASILELACETEPVSGTAEFIEYGKKVSKMIFENKAAELESDKGKEELTEVRAKLGENVTPRKYERYTGDLVSYYVHSNKKVGVLIEIELGDKSKSSDEKLRSLAKDLTLQIASLSPKAVSVGDLDPEFIRQEKEILVNQLIESDEKNKNKPKEILEKIVDGRIGKVLSDVCLLEQEFVKDKIKISDLIANVAKETQTTVKIKRFLRCSVSE